ncbi:MAG: redoxin family protein [Luteibacter sp.]
MRSPRVLLAFLAICIALVAAWPAGWAHDRDEAATSSSPAPEFTGIDRWINSQPLSLKKLRGKVVLVEFWTHECINCTNVVPHTEALYERHAKDGLVVVGVHTPEYDEERDVDGVIAATKRLGITYPVALDNGYATWNAYDNRFWPALYLIDQDGRIVWHHYGEGNYDETEARVRKLLGKA